MVEMGKLEGLPIMDPAAAVQLLGDKTVFSIMIDGMCTCIQKHLTEIKVSLEANEFSALRTQLQSLKGATAYTRCDRLGKATELLMEVIKSKKYDDIPEYYSCFVKESILLKRYIRKYICERDSKRCSHHGRHTF